jgi:hypothetical protein
MYEADMGRGMVPKDFLLAQCYGPFDFKDLVLFSPFEIIGLWPRNAKKKNPAFSHSFFKTGNLPLIRF